MKGEIKVGCCGFPVGRKKYYSEFKLIEVQKTFYQPPEQDLLKKWRVEAPDDFEFTIKAWQLITHPPNSPTYKKLEEKLDLEGAGYFRDSQVVRYGYEETIESAEALGANVVLFQTPASFKQEDENIKNLRRFFRKVRKAKFTFVWEPRGKWDRKLLQDLRQELGIFIAVDPFKDKPFPQEVIYLRLHGKGGYKYRYQKDELKELLSMIEALKFKVCYVLFNNVYMWEDALAFKQIL